MNRTHRMNLILQAVVVFTLLCSVGVGADHHAASPVASDSTTITSTLAMGDVPTITMTITPPLAQYSDLAISGQKFASISMNGEGFTTVLGEPQLPSIGRFIEIPYGAQPQLVVESAAWQTTSLVAQGLPAQIAPVQPSLVKVEGATVSFTMNDAVYTTDSFNPSTVAQISVLGEIRGRTCAFIEIFPVQYNPATGALRIITQCTLRIELPGSDMTQTERNIDRYASPDFDQQYQVMFANDGMFQGTGQNSPKEQGYLIIADDALLDAIQPLADWKTILGFSTTVTATSTIPGGVTKQAIKTYIKDAYENWTTPPAYVLLVGDVSQIPTWTGTETGTCTDLYYATVDQGNYFADVIISRFPAANAAQVTAMVDKTIYYEQGDFENTSWIQKAVFMASNDNYQVSEGTHNYVINTYLIPHNFTYDKLYCHTYGATTSQVTAAIDDGRGLAIYSGHGSTDSWADGPPFSQANVNALTNDGIYPFVCSHACLTNQFTVSECFGETWVRAAHKGALAFWGATDYSYWDEDDILERSMFKAWWDDNIETIGGMTNMGLYYLYQYYSGGGMTLYYFEEYNVLGDSSVKILRGESGQNTPPGAPSQPYGPSNGETGVEYNFTTSTTDVQHDQIYYMIAWGDEVSDWIGPYASGATVTFAHTWTAPGDYDITVKAKDEEGLESGWSIPATIHVLAIPRIVIGNITGGFGISAEIMNVGAGPAMSVNWSISLDGGLVLLGRQTTGTFEKIMPGFNPKAKTGFVLGFGSVDIHVVAGDTEKTVSALLIGPFFLNME